MTEKELFKTYWEKWSHPIFGCAEEVRKLKDECIAVFGADRFSDMEWVVLKHEAKVCEKLLAEHPELDYVEGEVRNDEKELAQWNAYKDEVLNWIETNFDSITAVNF